MQASLEESEVTSSPSLSSEFPEEFNWKMKLHDLDIVQTENSTPSNEEVEENDDDDDDEEEEEEEEEEEFTFACIGAGESTIAADDAFQNGQIKPIFPLFDQSILLASDTAPARVDLPSRPSVKKVLIEAEDSRPLTVSEEKIEGLDGEAAGEYCTWSRKAVEASPEICKKSNSTGFSKIWRFRELTNRSNSDGRDAFVFFNTGSTTKSSEREEKVEKGEGSSATKTVAAAEVKANSGGGKAKTKKGKKGEKPSLSAHELHYVTNRAAREGDRRRSYLPYKPGVVGFFTNVNGGLSRNVHPF